MFKTLGLRPSENGFRLEPKSILKDPILEGYDMLTEMEIKSMEIIHEHLYSTYTGTRDGNADIVLEGLGDMVSSGVRFFKELIRRLVEFFKKSSMYMLSLFMNFENFIKRYEKELTSVNKEYTMVGYEYDFSKKIPNTEAMMTVVSDFNSEMKDATKLKKADLVKRRDEFLESGKMDIMRGAIINKNGPVEESEFRETVREMFRQGKDTEFEIRVDSAKLRQHMSDFPKLKKTFDECKKDKYNLEKLYQSLENFFSKGPKREYVGSTKKLRTNTLDVDINARTVKVSTDFDNYEDNSQNLDVLNYYYSFKWKQAQEIGTYTFQAYIEKINALKEAVKFSEKLIRGAIFASPVEKGV